MLLETAHPELFNFAGCNYSGVRLIIPAGIIDIIFSVSLANTQSTANRRRFINNII
jgi:hypothetical protein